jgi:ribosomal protein L3 glutamine methyltransferase
MSQKIDILSDLSTIRDFIRYGFTEFNKNNLYFGHGTDNSWDEIIALVTYSLNIVPNNLSPDNLNPDNLNILLDAKLLIHEKQNLIDLINKRINEKTPLAYLIQQTNFCDLNFYVDKRVIIPRSPIGSLIQEQFSPWIEEPNNITSALDLCTGSGCIAIALAYYFPEANIDAIDLSDDALAVTNINIKKHELQNQVKAIKSDLFNSIKANKKYDLIISNPPYVNKKDLEQMPKEYHHEPKMALEAGDDGLDLAHRILKEAINYLNPNGILIVEVGNSQYDLEKEYPNIPFTWMEFDSGASGVFLLTYDQLKNI